MEEVELDEEEDEDDEDEDEEDEEDEEAEEGGVRLIDDAFLGTPVCGGLDEST